MKVLLIGDSGGSFLLNFVKYTRSISMSVEFDVLNNHDSPDGLQSARASGNFNNVYSYFRTFGIIDKIPKVRGIFKNASYYLLEDKILSRNKYDVILLFGLWPMACKFFDRWKAKNVFWVGVVMGSDYLQMENRRDKGLFLKTIKSCNRLMVGNPILFKRILEENLIEPRKLRSVYFGLEPLEIINSLHSVSRNQAKSTMNILPETVVITCGYNANPNQQHLKIIETLKESTVISQDHLIIIPLTYGGSKEYKLQILNALNDSRLKFILIENYLSNKEIAYLRKATDIFIQVQVTDAFSGSMQENLFCGNVVITGDWLPYKELKDRGISFYEVSQISEIKEKLKQILPQLPKIISDIQKINTPDKFSTGFWINNIRDWYNVLLEYKKEN